MINNSVINATIFKTLFMNRYIGTRFDEVNKHMQNLLIKKKYWLRNTCKKPAVIVHQCTLRTDNYKQMLWISM